MKWLIDTQQQTQTATILKVLISSYCWCGYDDFISYHSLWDCIAGNFGSHAHIVFAFGLQISEIMECLYPFQLIINWLIILSNCLFISGALINRNKSENGHYGIIFPQRWKFFISAECLSTHQRHSHHHMRHVTIILVQGKLL